MRPGLAAEVDSVSVGWMGWEGGRVVVPPAMGRLGAASGLDLPVTEPALAAPPPSLGPWFFHSLVTMYRTRQRKRGRAKSGRGHGVGRWASQVCGLLEELAQGSWGWGRGWGAAGSWGLSQLGGAAEWTCEVGARSSLAVSELCAHSSCSSGAGRPAGPSGRADVGVPGSGRGVDPAQELACARRGWGAGRGQGGLSGDGLHGRSLLSQSQVVWGYP